MERIQQESGLQEIRQAKMKLVAAHERGEARLLSQVLQSDAAQQEALVDFVAGLYATDFTDQEVVLPLSAELVELGARARQRALRAVFVGAPVVSGAPVTQTAPPTTAAQTPQVPLPSFTQARKAAGLALVDLARRLSLGTDVVQKLEQGRLVAASIPHTLAERLAEALHLSSEQVWALLRTPPAMRAQPALLRRRTGGKTPEHQAPDLQTFAEAIQHSPSMTADQRAAWLNETGKEGTP